MVRRRESLGWVVFRRVWAAVFIVLAVLTVALGTRKSIDGPEAPLWRWRHADAPRVILSGTLHAKPVLTLESSEAMCVVQHESYERCGKSSCWVVKESMTSSRASLERAGGESLALGSDFRIDPEAPSARTLDRDRAIYWSRTAQAAGLGFRDDVVLKSNHRVVERCIADGEPVVIEGCVDGNAMHACPGQSAYGVVHGEDPQAAIDAAADTVAMRVGIAGFLVLIAIFGLVRKKGVLVDALASRVGPSKGMGALDVVAIIVMPVAFVGNFFFHAWYEPSTWATGRSGMVAMILAIASWFLFARTAMRRRRLVDRALQPVLRTERSPLATANGTVELAVRAKKKNDGVLPIIGDDVLAFHTARVTETYTAGKSQSTREVTVIRTEDDLTVVDESGEGVLHLTNAILDVERRALGMREPPPRITARGIRLEPVTNHVQWTVEEHVIHDGEPLYVFGEVADVTLQNDERSYRAVRGSPKLGSDAFAPLLVFAGDERGLVASLAAEARHANGLAILGGLVCGGLTLAAAFLAWL